MIVFIIKGFIWLYVHLLMCAPAIGTLSLQLAGNKLRGRLQRVRADVYKRPDSSRARAEVVVIAFTYTAGASSLPARCASAQRYPRYSGQKRCCRSSVHLPVGARTPSSTSKRCSPRCGGGGGGERRRRRRRVAGGWGRGGGRRAPVYALSCGKGGHTAARRLGGVETTL